MKLIKVLIAVAALLLPFQVSAQNIAVDPTTWDYGGVELGSSEPMIFTAESIGPETPLYVSKIAVFDNDASVFQLVSVIPDEPVSLDEGETLEIVVNFTPSAEGMTSASLLILSDAHNYPQLFIPLQGEGVLNEPTPDEMMEAIMTYYNDAVASGAIVGLGNGNAPSAHLRIFLGMLDSADDLIVAGDYDAACDQLDHSVVKSDGFDAPPDFIGGSGVSSLNIMILGVMSSLGC